MSITLNFSQTLLSRPLARPLALESLIASQQSPLQLLGGDSAMEANPLTYTLLLLLIALVPFILLSVTSFVKLSVVFAILRNALGGGQIPSTAVGTLLSLVLSFQIMAPVFADAFAQVDMQKSLQSWDLLAGDLVEASVVFQEFLKRHSGERELEFFSSISKESPFSIVPAFIISELKEAFAIGFAIYLPFLIIDLVIANLLVGMGMMMVSPVTLSVPCKIALFVICDGWFALCSGLVLGYQGGG
jgi:type III secretion protein R